MHTIRKLIQVQHRTGHSPGSAPVAVWGNAIFDQRIWNRKGAVEAPDETDILYCGFPTLLAATLAYVMNLNSHGAYATFRERRAEFRQTGRPLNSAALAGGLLKYSERGQAYVDQLRSVMAINRLGDLDEKISLPLD